VLSHFIATGTFACSHHRLYPLPFVLLLVNLDSVQHHIHCLLLVRSLSSFVVRKIYTKQPLSLSLPIVLGTHALGGEGLSVNFMLSKESEIQFLRKSVIAWDPSFS
jgi:hypothetical protein